MTGALYLSVKDAAALMGCSVTTVKRGIAAGTIPAIRPGGPTSWARVPRAWIEEAWKDARPRRGDDPDAEAEAQGRLGDDRIRTDA